MAIEKIYVNKSDEPSLIAEKIIDTSAEEVVLNIPKYSKIADSLANFHLIKREAEALGKKIAVESVDDKVIELCGISGIQAVNPFFVKSGRQFSDILLHKRKDRNVEPKVEYAVAKGDILEAAHRPRRKKSHAYKLKPKKLFLWAGAAAVAIFVLLAALNFLPRAEIKIITRKTNWQYKDSVVVDKALASFDITAGVRIPGQLFSQKSNLSLSYPASGRKQISRKATGIITVFNAYSSSLQNLVATTRFQSPDGKIFRLVKSITVPGAEVVDGKIIPSSVDVEVVADQPGPEYNIGPVERFSIPGFKGSPKYNSFYGQSSAPMTGGFVGEAAYPTAADIQKARDDSAQKLEDSLKSTLLVQVPSDFKIIDGAMEFSLNKQNVIEETDASGNFSVFSEGVLNVLAFREGNLTEALIQKAQKEAGKDNLELKSHTLAYSGKPRVNFKIGQMSFPVDFTSVLAPKIDVSLIRQEVSGKSEADLRALIFSLADLDSAKVSFWPFWVKKVPASSGRLKIIVE